MQLRQDMIIAVLLSAAMLSCGNSEDANKEATGDSQSVFNVDLSLASAGDQYIIMPYILGDTAVVNGKTSTAAGSYSVSSSGTSLRIQEQKRDNLSLNLNHSLRTILNRFDPRDRKNRDRTYTQLQRLATQNKNNGVPSSYLIKDFLKFEHSLATAESLKSNYPLQTEACPTSFYVPASTEAISINDAVVARSSDQGDFCLIHLVSTVASEQDVSKIEASIQQAIASYKVIFNTEFSESLSSYSFKPLFIVLPTDNPSYWLASEASVSGVFISSISLTHQRPTIYIAADQKISGATEANEVESFHSTIAHELFHAVFHYFRVWVNGDGTGESDTVSLDEGIAHFMEDLLGYGPLNFTDYAGTFLSQFPSSSILGPTAILDETQTLLENINRGAAQTLIYYLVSQKGGFEFTSGRPTGGGGMTFIRDFVTGEQSGVAGLAAAYGGSWSEAFANYVSALNVEGSEMASTVHSTQDLVSVVNLLGDSSTYGMGFTNFSGLPTLEDRLADQNYTGTFLPSELQDVPVYYYEATPYLLTVEDSDASFILNFAAAYKNAGVAVVKVQ